MHIKVLPSATQLGATQTLQDAHQLITNTQPPEHGQNDQERHQGAGATGHHTGENTNKTIKKLIISKLPIHRGELMPLTAINPSLTAELNKVSDNVNYLITLINEDEARLPTAPNILYWGTHTVMSCPDGTISHEALLPAHTEQENPSTRLAQLSLRRTGRSTILIVVYENNHKENEVCGFFKVNLNSGFTPNPFTQEDFHFIMEQLDKLKAITEGQMTQDQLKTLIFSKRKNDSEPKYRYHQPPSFSGCFG